MTKTIPECSSGGERRLCQNLYFFRFISPSRSKMPEKTDEERERMAKKLAEQRAKMEGMPTTAKVASMTLGAAGQSGTEAGLYTSLYLFLSFVLSRQSAQN